MDTGINIGQELHAMIDELSARTGGGPVRIMCNQDTLNQLWEQSGMVYSSDADVENNTGYVARYNGLPIVVAPQVETGKFFLLPDASQTRPIRVEFEDTTNEQPIQVVFDDTPGYVYGTAFTGTTFDFVETEPRTIASDLDGVIRKFMTGKGLFSKRNSAKEEQVEIDEDKFLDILGFGKPNVSG